jgi:heat shock protein HslJ
MRRLLLLAIFLGVTKQVPAKDLENTRWHLLEIGGQTVKIEEEKQRPYFQLASANRRVEGFGGCNRFQGSYKLEGNRLSFQNMLSTLRACADDSMNDRERDLLSALDAATTYKLSEGVLELTDGAKVLARFGTKE